MYIYKSGFQKVNIPLFTSIFEIIKMCLPLETSKQT